jgi:hypothetical protein
VHEEGHRICSDREGRVVFFSPQGRAIADAPRAPHLGPDPAADLMRANKARGVDLAWDTIMPSHHHSAPIPWEIEADAWEALDRAAQAASRESESLLG